MKKNYLLPIFTLFILCHQNLLLQAQNKLEYLQVATVEKIKINNAKKDLSEDLFHPSNAHSIDFQGISKGVKPEYVSQRVVKMSYTGTEPDEWKYDNTSHVVWYRNVYEGTDLLLDGNDENTIYTFFISPDGRLSDISFLATDDFDWSLIVPTISQEINGKTKYLKGFFQVENQKIVLNCNDFDLGYTVKVTFSRQSNREYIFTKK